MLKVIGAGFPRTGTSSMKAALEQLGLGPCHHMFEVFANPAEQGERWHAAALAKHDTSDPGRTVDWDWVLEGYRSAVDWPSGHFWQEIAAAYPDSKIILTTRDPHRWYRSMRETIFAGIDSDGGPGDRLGSLGAMMEIIFGATFGDADRAPTEDHAVEVYRRHVEHVRATAPADRLLVHEASDGWAPLCAFLGVEVPDTPYPHLNDTRALQEFTAKMRDGGTASTPFGDITFPANQTG